MTVEVKTMAVQNLNCGSVVDRKSVLSPDKSTTDVYKATIKPPKFKFCHLFALMSFQTSRMIVLLFSIYFMYTMISGCQALQTTKQHKVMQ